MPNEDEILDYLDTLTESARRRELRRYKAVLSHLGKRKVLKRIVSSNNINGDFKRVVPKIITAFTDRGFKYADTGTRIIVDVSPVFKMERLKVLVELEVGDARPLGIWETH